MKPYNFKLTRDRLRLLDRAVLNFPDWAKCCLSTPEDLRPSVLLAFWGNHCMSIRPAYERDLWKTMRDESDRKLSQEEAELIARQIPPEAEEERRHYDQLATRIRTDGGRKCKSMLDVIQSGISSWRSEDRPLLERTLEIAMNCDWRDLAVEDLFCTVVGDECHRRLLAGIFKAGRGSVVKDPELARFWDRAAEKYAKLVDAGDIPEYDAQLPPPMPPCTRVETDS